MFINPSEYKGKQIIFNSDRILFNAKENDILLFSRNYISLSSSNQIHLNCTNEAFINASKIYLGLDNNSLPNESAVLGNKLYNKLNILHESLNILYNSLINLKGTIDSNNNIEVQVEVNEALDKLNEFNKDLKKEILSDKVFISK